MNHADILWHITRVVPSAPRRLKIFAAPFVGSVFASIFTSIFVSIALLAALVTLGGACSSGPESGTCTNMFPSSCTVTPPSFATDVASVIHARCTPCHGPGQQVPTLDTYANVTIPKTESRIIFVYQMCSMPPKPNAPLTTAEWETITSWLKCGAAP
jgi:hypothetical protein